MLCAFLSTPVLAEQASLGAGALPELVLSGAGVSSMTTSATLPVSPLVDEKRPFALALGIALVVGAFSHSFVTRQRARG